MDDADKLFEQAIKLRNKNLHDDAILLLKKFIKLFPHHSKTYGVYVVLSGIYLNGKIDYKKSLSYAKKSKKLKKDNELSSLIIYLCYSKLDEDGKAIREMIRFLKGNKADLYKITIEELLDGLKKGYMTDYQNQILLMAKNNEIKTPKKLLKS